MKNEKSSKLHFVSVSAFVIFIVLGLACASTPTIPMELNERYMLMPQQPTGSERIIASIRIIDEESLLKCRTDQERHPGIGKRLGAPYQAFEGTERHRHERILDLLLNEARILLPNETIDIRNAIIAGYVDRNPRPIELSSSDGRKWTETEYDCRPVFTADIVTTEPAPQPITYANNISREGQSRFDLYGRLHRELINFRHTSARVEIKSQNSDLGSITGVYFFTVNTGQEYLIIAPFQIYVFDGSAEILFKDVGMENKPIFLQSIANLAHAEITNFANNLVSSITPRN